MPFRSQAQRHKFAQLLVEEKISDETLKSGIAKPVARSCRSAFAHRRKSRRTRRHLADRERQRSGLTEALPFIRVKELALR